MGNNHKTIKELLDDLPTYPVPDGLDKKVLYAIHTERQRSERIHFRLWASGLFSSILAALLGLAWSLQSLNTGETMEIIKTAFSNFEALRFSDIFWGIMETLPLNGLALIFCAVTILGILTSIRKNNRTNTLSLQHI